MKQTSPPELHAASEATQPTLPTEPITLAPENTPDPPSSETTAPYEPLEHGDDRYYAYHWGINE